MRVAFAAQNFGSGPGGVVFGGQLLAQTIVAGATVDPTKEVKSVHTVFARGGALDQPLDIEVEAMHVGRALGSATVTVRQGDRLCTRSLVLLSAVEPDLIRHGSESPSVGAPEDSPLSAHEAFWEIRVVDDVDISDPSAVGPAELFVWSRFPGSGDVGTIGQALLAYATDGFLIGTAMRPHAGFGPGLVPCRVLDQRAHPHPDLSRADRRPGSGTCWPTRAPMPGAVAPMVGPTSSPPTAAWLPRSCRRTWSAPSPKAKSPMRADDRSSEPAGLRPDSATGVF